jgi:hypothetical protein
VDIGRPFRMFPLHGGECRRLSVQRLFCHGKHRPHFAMISAKGYLDTAAHTGSADVIHIL